MSVFVISVIRTWVPILVGGFVAWIVTITNLPVEPEATLALTTFTTLLAIALYYLLIRWLETKFPWMGWLIGYAKAPALYVNPVHPPASTDDNLTHTPQGRIEINNVPPEMVHPEFMTRDQLKEKEGSQRQDPGPSDAQVHQSHRSEW